MTEHRDYEQELRDLEDTWGVVLSADISVLEEALLSLVGVPTVYVASGGGLAVARFAADLHGQHFGTLSRAVTPLELIGLGPSRETAYVLFSARARHHDLLLALRHASIIGSKPPILVTQKPSDAITPKMLERVQVVNLPEIPKDGFLATNSVLLMAGMVAKMHEARLGRQLPRELPAFHQEANCGPPKGRMLVLYGPPSASVAVDLETRMAETGLAQVQVSDLRNFGHGRHRGYARNRSRTSVLMLTQQETASLAAATRYELPGNTDWIDISTTLSGPVGTLNLLVLTMKFVGIVARNRAVDVSSADVPDYGRSLYNMEAGQFVHQPAVTPVDLKLQAAGLGTQSQAVRDAYSAAYDTWLQVLYDTPLGGVVLDHDGTCTTTVARDQQPPTAVQTSLIRLIRQGCPIVFCSGRGASLYGLLRQWIPQDLWKRVIVAPYSGSVWSTLERIPTLGDALDEDISEAAQRLLHHPIAKSFEIDARLNQITLTPKSRGTEPALVASVVQDLLRRPRRLRLSVNVSGHSVDITTKAADKAQAVFKLQAVTGLPVMAIGDQGHYPGNDHTMLASTLFSLSVDSMSGDPTRCWRVGKANHSGPELLLDYLSRMEYHETLRYGRRQGG